MGTVNEQSIEIIYEAAPGVGAVITEVSYTINGEEKGWLYLSNAEADDPRSKLGKGWVQLSSGENHIIFTVEDFMRRSETFEVKQRPILELYWDIPEYNAEKVLPSKRYDDWLYIIDRIIVTTAGGKGCY